MNYIEHKLFGQTIDYFEDNNWRVLMIEMVAEHTIKQIIQMIIQEQQSEIQGEAESIPLRLSSIDSFSIRENYALDVSKCIYPRIQYPSNK